LFTSVSGVSCGDAQLLVDYRGVNLAGILAGTQGGSRKLGWAVGRG